MLGSIVLAAVLQPGPHAVGFESLFLRDRTRSSVVSTDRERGRLVVASVWYPAQRGKGTPLTYGHYISLLGRLTTEERTGATDRAGAERFVALAKELSPDAAAAAKIDTIRGIRMSAVESAAALPGRSPVFIFPEYRSPARHAFMAEYLASHGFVVLSVPFIGSFDEEFDTGTSGVETNVADIRHAMSALAGKAYADVTRIAIGGVGLAANIAVRYALQSPEVDAIVSLDGGLPSRFEDSLVKKSAFYDRAALRFPMLIIESPWEGMDSSLLDQYRNARRTIVKIPKMREFHYLDYGALERVAPGVIGEAPADVERGYPWALHFVRAFLEEELLGRPGAVQSLRPPEGLLTVEQKVPGRAVPTAVELRRLVQKEGAGAATKLYAELKKNDPQPFDAEILFGLVNWFGWGRDEDMSRRRALLEILVDSFPSSARARFALANICHAKGDSACAKAKYQETLDRLPDDFDAALDAGTRNRMTARARERLAM